MTDKTLRLKEVKAQEQIAASLKALDERMARIEEMLQSLDISVRPAATAERPKRSTTR